MANQNVPDLKELFGQAAEIAQQLPESMQEAAFNRALDLLLGKTFPEKKTREVHPKQKTVEPNQGQAAKDVCGTLLQQIDSTQYPGVRSATKVLDRSLMVLQIALREYSVDGLTSVEIARILTEKFRLSTSRQAVGMALKPASNLVDRVAEGRSYRYRIMVPGEDYLTQLEEDDNDDQLIAPTKKRSTRSHRKAKVTSSDSAQSADAGEPASAGSSKKTKAKPVASSRLGPKAAIVALIEADFFASPKTGPEVQEYLKRKRGFDLGIPQLRLAMLRLVRDGVLERDENDKGQYEYKRP